MRIRGYADTQICRKCIEMKKTITQFGLLLFCMTTSVWAAGPVSVMDFGAKADGKTDDAPAFAKALEAGKDVYVPAGTYYLSSLTLPKGASLHGAGVASTLICPEDKTVLSLQGDTKISRLRFVGEQKQGRDWGPQARALIDIVSVKNVTVEDIRVEDYKNTAVRTEHAHDVIVRDCYLQNVNWGVDLSFSHNVKVLSTTVIDAHMHGIQFWGNYNFQTQDSSDLIFADNYVKNGGGGAIWGTGAQRVVMQGNIIDGAEDVGLDLEWCTDGAITGNVVRNCKNGGISLFFACQRVTISGNTILNDSPIPADAPKDGWWVRSGIWLTFPNRETFKDDHGHRDITITNNTIVCVADGPRRGIWIGSESDNVLLANNLVANGQVFFGGQHKVNPPSTIRLPDNVLLKNGKVIRR